MDAVAVLEVQHPIPGAGEARILEGNYFPTQNCNPTAEMVLGATLPNSAPQKGTGLAGPETPSRSAGLTSLS